MGIALNPQNILQYQCSEFITKELGLHYKIFMGSNPIAGSQVRTSRLGSSASPCELGGPWHKQAMLP